MTESEKRVKAISLYDDWCETDTEDSLEIFCYEKGRADAIKNFAEWLIKYKVIPDGAMAELVRDFRGETEQK